MEFKKKEGDIEAQIQMLFITNLRARNQFQYLRSIDMAAEDYEEIKLEFPFLFIRRSRG